MEVIVTKKARNDLHDFFYKARANTENYVISYINELVDYTDLILISPRIGKVVDIIKQYEIRQVIHKKHKILYTIFNNQIFILRFIHTSRNFNLRKNLNLIDFPNLY